MKVFNQLLNKARQRGAGHLVLLDPDKGSPENLAQTAVLCEQAGSDGFLLGGSLVASESMDVFVQRIKAETNLPVILFPGATVQLSALADAVLFLSLLSGRNPHYLIGEQVVAAPRIKAAGIETIGTGYLLVESGETTSVEYMSHTRPIPSNKPDLAAAHAMAAEMLGFQCIYLEAGSGAINPVPENMIKRVRKSVHLPLITGGGIRTAEQAEKSARAGSDFIVTGTVVESHSDLSVIKSLADAVHWKEKSLQI